jgi:hypothetical protein
MKIEKYEEWLREQEDTCCLVAGAWSHQEQKILDIYEYISKIGHQKELDYFLKVEKDY